MGSCRRLERMNKKMGATIIKKFGLKIAISAVFFVAALFLIVQDAEAGRKGYGWVRPSGTEGVNCNASTGAFKFYLYNEWGSPLSGGTVTLDGQSGAAPFLYPWCKDPRSGFSVTASRSGYQTHKSAFRLLSRVATAAYNRQTRIHVYMSNTASMEIVSPTSGTFASNPTFTVINRKLPAFGSSGVLELYWRRNGGWQGVIASNFSYGSRNVVPSLVCGSNNIGFEHNEQNSIAVSGIADVTITKSCVVPNNTLNVRSSPPTGISMGGNFPGTTNYSKTTSANIVGWVAAPSDPAGYTFSNWSGCDSIWSGSNKWCWVDVRNGATQTVTANYVVIPNNTLNVRSSPPTGISMGGNFPGTTNYSKTTSANIVGWVAAPSDPAGYTFSNWSGCDSIWSGSNKWCWVDVRNGATQTVTANYVNATGTILGRLFRDDNGNGGKDGGEPLIRNNSAMACAGDVNSSARVSISGPSSSTQYPTKCNPEPYYSAAVLVGNYIVTAIPPPGWEVTSSNPTFCTVTSGSQCHRWFAMRPIPPGCLISINSITAQPIEQSDSASYDITVSSVAGFSGDVYLSTNDLSGDEITLTIPEDDDGDIKVTLAPEPGGNSILPVFTTVTADTTLTTPIGTYDIEIDGESSDANQVITCSAQATLEVKGFQADPWLKTTGGDVGSFFDINMTRDIFSDEGLYNADYLVITKTPPLIVNFDSEEGWEINTYGGLTLDPDPTSSTMYDVLWDKYGGDSQGDRSGATLNQGNMVSTVVSDGGVMRWVGNIDGVNLWNYQGAPAVIFVDGSMTIDADMSMDADTGVIFIVKEDIIVDDDVIEIAGVFITNGVFNSHDTNSCGVASDGYGSDDRLVINGAVHAFGQLCFTRDPGGASNLNTPAELINYEPKYLYLFQEIVGDPTVIYREISP